MASRTQLRLGQITGSFGDQLGGIIDTQAKGASGDINGVLLHSGSLVGILSHVASSILRIHGHDNFANNDFSVLKDLDGENRITYAQGGATTLGQDDGTVILQVNTAGNLVALTGSLLPEADRTRNLGSTSARFLEIHGAVTGALSGPVAGTGINNDEVVVSNNGALEGSSGFTFDGTTLTLGAGQDLSVGRNATIEGDLTVNGTTTTVNSTTVSIDDRFILLADGAGSANTNSGILFTSGSNVGARPDIVFGKVNGANNTWGLGTIASKSGSIANTSTGNFTDTLLRAGTFEVAGATNTVGLNGADLKITAAANLVLDAATDIELNADGADVIIKDNTVQYARLTNSSNSLILSGGAAGGDILLEPNSSTVGFVQQGNLGGEITVNMNKAQFVISGSQGNDIVLSSEGKVQVNMQEVEVGSLMGDAQDFIISSSEGRGIDFRSNGGKFTFSEDVGLGTPMLLELDLTTSATEALLKVDAFQNLAISGAPGSESLVISGTFVELKANPTAQALRFKEPTGAGNNFVGLSAPDTIASNFTLKLPNADATASGQALVSNGAGVLSFAAVGADATTKAIKVMSSRLASGSALFFSSVDHGATVTDLHTSGYAGIDVFVNGQLVLSGTEAQINASSVDYTLSGSDGLLFGFDLEVDDVVTVIKK